MVVRFSSVSKDTVQHYCRVFIELCWPVCCFWWYSFAAYLEVVVSITVARLMNCVGLFAACGYMYVEILVSITIEFLLNCVGLFAACGDMVIQRI